MKSPLVLAVAALALGSCLGAQAASFTFDSGNEGWQAGSITRPSHTDLVSYAGEASWSEESGNGYLSLGAGSASTPRPLALQLTKSTGKAAGELTAAAGSAASPYVQASFRRTGEFTTLKRTAATVRLYISDWNGTGDASAATWYVSKASYSPTINTQIGTSWTNWQWAIDSSLFFKWPGVTGSASTSFDTVIGSYKTLGFALLSSEDTGFGYTSSPGSPSQLLQYGAYARNGSSATLDVDNISNPEPGTGLLLLAGIVPAGYAWRRRKRNLS